MLRICIVLRQFFIWTEITKYERFHRNFIKRREDLDVCAKQYSIMWTKSNDPYSVVYVLCRYRNVRINSFRWQLSRLLLLSLCLSVLFGLLVRSISTFLSAFLSPCLPLSLPSSHCSPPSFSVSLFFSHPDASQGGPLSRNRWRVSVRLMKSS